MRRLFFMLSLVLVAIVACGGDRHPGQPVIVAEDATIVAEQFYCGSPMDECMDRHATTIDFAKATLERSRCVAHGAENPTTDEIAVKRDLSTHEVARLRSSLAALRFERLPQSSWDGAMFTLTVESGPGHGVYTPDIRCAGGLTIVTGWDDFWRTVEEL